MNNTLPSFLDHVAINRNRRRNLALAIMNVLATVGIVFAAGCALWFYLTK